MLAACTQFPTAENTQISLSYQTDDIAYVETVTTETIDAFVNGQGPAPIQQIPPDFLSPAQGPRISYKIQKAKQVGIRIRTRQPISRKADLFGVVSLAAGESQFLLPNGAGILVQPIRLRYKHISIDANTGIRYYFWSTHKSSFSVEAAAGARLIKVDTTISSPVLFARHNSVLLSPYISTGVQFGFGQKVADSSGKYTLEAQWRLYPQTDTQTITAGLGYAF